MSMFYRSGNGKIVNELIQLDQSKLSLISTRQNRIFSLFVDNQPFSEVVKVHNLLNKNGNIATI